jgi:CheY-like chemotaxis protein
MAMDKASFSRRKQETVRVLIVEDELKTAAYLRQGLSEHGFIVDIAEQGEDGLHLARTGPYDLIVLDVMLPERDGWSLLAELRRSGTHTPVLFLTARDAIHDRVKGLELGADDDTLIVRVRDTGIGIAPEHLPKIFDRFYRVDPARSQRYPGMGLGLAIVKSIMALHGGTVTVESVPHQGTTITLRFPLPGEARR